ncbi:hypothetical protein HDA32_006068 [Spinactinospora alkalitolerans]|uniref:Uncharacterized protein n=1 Tax=Spinactinospora alkalitolerans TaxID=687207 RepID=A0A852U402_9ACTN|nr:hypothetical protein [Spinactinospora alkalitolerans]NYE50948.1 hypothetical protein [Spinactinospora alkalitolerans]
MAAPSPPRSAPATALSCAAASAALARVRRDFPAWAVFYAPDAPAWRRWTAVRRLPLLRAERLMRHRSRIVGSTLDGFLSALGAEQRTQDRHAHVLRGTW